MRNLIQVIRVDGDGSIVEPLVVYNDEVLGDGIVKTPVPEGLYVPKWDGSKWVEGADDAYKKTVDTPGSALTDIEVLQEENAELKTRLASTEAAILSLMDYV